MTEPDHSHYGGNAAAHIAASQAEVILYRALGQRQHPGYLLGCLLLVSAHFIYDTALRRQALNALALYARYLECRNQILGRHLVTFLAAFQHFLAVRTAVAQATQIVVYEVARYHVNQGRQRLLLHRTAQRQHAHPYVLRQVLGILYVVDARHDEVKDSLEVLMVGFDNDSPAVGWFVHGLCSVVGSCPLRTLQNYHANLPKKTFLTPFISLLINLDEV